MFGSLDRQHRLCEGFSSCISESRDRRYVRHDLLKLIRQRVLQIVAGYEDCNDADTLRSDPMLKTVCDQLPESDPDLATQPTFSRLENSVTKKDLMRRSQWLLGRYVRSLKKRRPSKIILDLDSTDDHTHGQQEFSFYHGYYRNHILHPLLIFDADTGDLVCVVLRTWQQGGCLSHRAHSEASRGGHPTRSGGRMSRLRFGPTAALPRLGSTSSVKVKRINSNMSLG